MLSVSALAVALGVLAPGPIAPSIHNPAPPPPLSVYQFTTVALPGAPNTVVVAINDGGEYTGITCGEVCNSVFVSSARSKPRFFTLPFANFNPEGRWVATGIDDAGDVAGYYSDSQGAFHGFVRSVRGTFTELNDPLAGDGEGQGTFVESMSADGSAVVGSYVDSGGLEHGFVYMGGHFTTYDVPGAAGTELAFYHDGEFGGLYESDEGVLIAFYVRHGQLETVSAPDLPNPASGEGDFIVAVTADGTLIGDELSNGPSFGFAYRNGRYTLIKDPHEVGASDEDGTFVTSANLQGTAVGQYSYAESGDVYGFVAATRPWPLR